MLQFPNVIENFYTFGFYFTKYIIPSAENQGDFVNTATYVAKDPRGMQIRCSVLF